MANYTITRQTESGHVYGCTNFSTIQQAGQVSSVVAGAALDETIVWNLSANPGYEVLLESFELTTGNIITQTPSIHTYVNMPSPIYKVEMEQISTVLIRITIYLGTSGGTAFTMPNSDIDRIPYKVFC